MSKIYVGNDRFLDCCASRDLQRVITLLGGPAWGGAAQSYTGIVMSIEHTGNHKRGREWCVSIQDSCDER
jgi:hypothetical protein